MSNKIPRNAPCPCGSGEKYKRCHGAPGMEAKAQEDGIGVIEMESRGVPKHVLIGIGAATVVGSVGLGVTNHSEWALMVLGLGIMGIIGLIVFGNLPPPRDDAGDPGAINFGR